jgi:hypothetical protein
MIDEIMKNLDMISIKSGLKQEEIKNVLNILLEHITLVSFDEVKNFLSEGRRCDICCNCFV